MAGRRVRVALVAAVFLGLATPVVAATTNPFATQQASIRAGLTITKASTALLASARSVEQATISDTLPEVKKCANVASCVLPGPTPKSPEVRVWGDSHVLMWLPTIYRIFHERGFAVNYSWYPGCGPAKLTQYLEGTPNFGKTCDKWREQMINLLIWTKPKYLIIAERTSEIYSAKNKVYSEAQFTGGLKTTLRRFSGHGIKIAVIGDNPTMKDTFPAWCVGMHMSNVGACTSPVVNADPLNRTRASAERSVVTSLGYQYIDTSDWFCWKGQCPVAVGNQVIYRDSGHLSYRYTDTLPLLLGPPLRRALGL